LKRNTEKRGYRYKQAQGKTDTCRRQAVKLTPLMIEFIESKLWDNWSPEQVSGWLLKVRQVRISNETIYLHVWRDKQTGGDLHQHLRRKGKKYQSRSTAQAGRGDIKNRGSIHKRPAIIDDRGRAGDWEINFIIGKGHRGAPVTIVKRFTRFTVSAQVDNKSADTVTKATIDLLLPFKDLLLSITTGNGKGVAYHEQMAEKLEPPVYFAAPYSSWQRGLNENTNGLLRQYWLKGTDLKTVTTKEVDPVIVQLNNRPRKILAYKTPSELMAEHIAAIAA